MADTSEIFTISNYIKFATIPAILILLILTLLQRRAKPNNCGRLWPSLVVPMRFLDGYHDRLSYALSFGAITSILMSVFTQTVVGSSTDAADSPNINDALFCGSSNSSSGACKEVWVRTLLFQTQSLMACLVCAPHFVCISTPFKLIGAICGFGYSAFWTVFYVYGAVQGERNYGRKYGTLLLLGDVPIIVCFAGLCIRSVWVCYRCYATKTYSVQIVDNIVEQHQVNHVAALFEPVSEEPPPPLEGLLEKIKTRLKPRIFPHFKLPARIICIAVVQIIIIYIVGILMTTFGVALHSFLKLQIQNGLLSGITKNGTDMTIVEIVDGVYTLSAVLGFLSSLIYITIFVVNYRIHMLRMYKGGKRSFLEKSQSSSKHVAQSLRLPGYQIAYIIWGFLLLFLVVFLILVIISLTIYTLDRLDLLSSAFDSLLQTLSVPLSTIAVFYLQIFLVRMFLLQPKLNEEDDNYPLNVDNRRLYEVVSYVLVFSNLMVGLASALFRTCKSFVLGIIFLGRLDRCLLMKGFETMDPGYMAYVGTLLVDNAHNNPAMRAFCAVLLRLTCKVSDKEKLGIQFLREPDRTCSNSRAARRWHLAYTLIHNPELLPRRKLALLLTRGMETNTDSGSSLQSGAGAGAGANGASLHSSGSKSTTSTTPISLDLQSQKQIEDSADYPSFREENYMRLASVKADSPEVTSNKDAWAVPVRPEAQLSGYGSGEGIVNSTYVTVTSDNNSRHAWSPDRYYV